MKQIILVLCLFMLCACSNEPINEVNKINQKVNCENAYDLVSQGALLVDVRNDYEYNERHLDKAVNYPLDSILVILDNLKISKDTPIIVYCNTGNRSSQAIKKLQKEGYSKLYDLMSINNCNK